MDDDSERSTRRSEALTRGQVVAAAVKILDSSGERGLTTRVLARELSTGSGAIYHYVTNKDEVLAAATDYVIADALKAAEVSGPAPAAVREVCLALFAVLDEHPWAGSQLSRDPGQPALIRIWTALGRHLAGLNLDATSVADAGSTLVSYVLGAAAQYAAGARNVANPSERAAFLEGVAAKLAADSQHELLAGDVESAIVEHDDRQQFLAGINIVLKGIGPGG